jgi:hypothetical protein
MKCGIASSHLTSQSPQLSRGAELAGELRARSRLLPECQLDAVRALNGAGDFDA